MGSFLSKSKKQEEYSSSTKRYYRRFRRFLKGKNQSSKQMINLQIFANEDKGSYSFEGKNSTKIVFGLHKQAKITELEEPHAHTRYGKKYRTEQLSVLSNLESIQEDYESRVERWLNLCNLDEQSYNGLHIGSESKHFNPVFNLDVTWDSNINLVYTDSDAFENSQIVMQSTKHDWKGDNNDFIPIYNLETKWNSNINLVSNDSDSRLESTVHSDSDYSSDDLEYDADISSDEFETESINSSCTQEENCKKEHKIEEDSMNMESFFQLSAVKKLYFLELYGNYLDYDGNIDYESESGISGIQSGCNCQCHH